MPAGLASQAGSWAGHLRFRGAKGGESWHELLPSGSSPGRSPLVPAAEEGTSVSWWCVCLLSDSSVIQLPARSTPPSPPTSCPPSSSFSVHMDNYYCPISLDRSASGHGTDALAGCLQETIAFRFRTSHRQRHRQF